MVITPDKLRGMIGVPGQSIAEGLAFSDAADEIERLRAALTKIAAYDDKGASMLLAQTGSYGQFDEPGSVSIAREALEKD